MNAEEIAEDIVNLTIGLDDHEELKQAWRVINKATQYLSAKDDYFTREMETLKIITEMKDKRVEEFQ
tara:strand:+ start:1274 stop:1474 length:201 start_codon:yes stop_codon:yes gene_type:complete